MVDSGLILYPVKQELAGWKWIPWFQSKGCGILEQHGQGFFFPSFFVGVQYRKESKNVFNKPSHAVNSYPNSSFTAQHMVTAAPKRNKKQPE